MCGHGHAGSLEYQLQSVNDVTDVEIVTRTNGCVPNPTGFNPDSNAMVTCSVPHRPAYRCGTCVPLAIWKQASKITGPTCKLAYARKTMSSSSDSAPQSPIEEAQPLPHSDKLWDVQAILAQRNSVFQSGSEVLVAWKPCWIPIENVPEGPLLISFRDAPKVRFQSSVGNLILPMEPNTALADDVAAAAERRDREIQQYREHFQHRSGGMQLQKRVRGTPRKALGSVAKRVPVQNTSKHKPQEQ